MIRIIALLLAFTVPAIAQQQPTAVDRIANTLGQCISKAESFVDEIAKLQADKAKLEARVKELEAKPEERK